MSVARAQEEISSREFVEWVAWDEMEPVGEERMDLRFAWLLDVMASAAGAQCATVGANFLRAMNFETPARPTQTDDQMKAICMGIVAQGGVMGNG